MFKNENSFQFIATLFSVSYAGLWGQHRLDLEAFIRKAGALGYPAVELMAKRPHLSLLDINEHRIEKLKACAWEAGVEIATIAAYTDFAGGASKPDIPYAEMQVLYIRELARLASVLGAGTIRVFTGYSTIEDGYIDDWTRCVNGLRESASAAAEFGVLLGVQNHHDTAISTAAYIELLDEVDHPNCKAMYDPWVPALLGEDLFECARKLAPRMVQTTLADYIRLDRFAYMPGLVNYRQLPAMLRAVPLGEGFLDLRAFFRGLKEGCFHGYVAYEMCSPLRGGPSEENLDRCAVLSLERMNSLIAGDATSQDAM